MYGASLCHVCVCVYVCTYVRASLIHLSPFTSWPETLPFTVIGLAPYVIKKCLLQCEVCVTWWCLLSDAANYSSNTHPRVRRSNSLTPPVSITQTSDFWSSQVCCSYQQCGMNIFIIFLLYLTLCLSVAMAVWFWMMDGKEAVMVCLKVVSQWFLGWAATTDKMLVKVAGPWLDSNLGPPRCKARIYHKDSRCKYCVLDFVLVLEKNVLR